MTKGVARLTKLERDRVRNEYISWLALDKTARRNLGHPLTMEEFATHVGVTSRTLRRWQTEPQFDKRVSQAKVRLAKGAPGATISRMGFYDPDLPDTLEPARNGLHPDLVDRPIEDEGLRDYESMKKGLRDRAVSGESEKALELWIKHFGKPYMEAEQRALESTFTDLTDGDLIDQTLRLIGKDAISAWLALQ